MNTNKKQQAIFSLLIDLLLLNGSIVFLSWFYTDIRTINNQQLISLLYVLNVSYIPASLQINKKWLYFRTDFLCRLEKIASKLLIYLLISGVSAYILIPGFNFLFLFKHSTLFFIGITFIYWLIYKYYFFKSNVEYNIQRVAIISRCKTGLMIERLIKSNPSLGYKFVGFLSENESASGDDVLGSVSDLDEIIREHQIQSIISVQNFDKSLVSICDRYGVRLEIVPKTERYNPIDSKLETIRIHKIPLDNKLFRVLKRAFDIIFSLSIIVCLLSWLMPIIALIIKVTSRGPVFFTQERTGIYNSTFTCYKFRSMVINNLSHIKQASKNDCRITPFGNFIRKTNIDELPQFFNVLFGQMSVVGPRPHMLNHTQYYGKMIKNYLMRHYIKPGVTGWAQVNGLHGETDELWKMEKRVEYDLYYIKHWKFTWDIIIVFKTLFYKTRILTAVNDKKVVSLKPELYQ